MVQFSFFSAKAEDADDRPRDHKLSSSVGANDLHGDRPGADDRDDVPRLHLRVEHSAFQARWENVAEHRRRLVIGLRWERIQAGVGVGDSNVFGLGAIDPIAKKPAARTTLGIHPFPAETASASFRILPLVTHSFLAALNRHLMKALMINGCKVILKQAGSREQKAFQMPSSLGSKCVASAPFHSPIGDPAWAPRTAVAPNQEATNPNSRH
jgi:hypothetical protein